METPPQKSAPPSQADRDIQRAALRDLIALSTECATTESEVERENRTSLEQEKKAVSDRGFQIEQQHKQQTAETKQKHEDQRAAITLQHQTEKAKISQADRAYRKKAEAEKQSIDEKVKKKFDQATWEADSVHEMSGAQIAGAFKQTSEE